MEFERLAKFPMEDEDDWIITTLIGGVMFMLGILVVPAFIAVGYLVEVMAGGVRGDPEPPAFEEWGELTVDGLKATVILFAYQIIPNVVGIGMFLLSFLFLASGSEAGAGIGILGILLTAGVWGVLSLVFGYVGMAGLVNFAVEDSLGAAFDLGVVKTVSFSGAWLKAWAFFVAIYIVAAIVGSVTGGLGSPFAIFYAMSSGYRGFGEAFAAATAKGNTATAATEATSASV